MGVKVWGAKVKSIKNEEPTSEKKQGNKSENKGHF